MVEDITLRLVHGLVVALVGTARSGQSRFKSQVRGAPRSSRGGRGRLRYPVLLEAILRAEETVLDAEFEARRALQGAGVILAVGPQAFFLGRWFGGHGARAGDCLVSLLCVGFLRKAAVRPRDGEQGKKSVVAKRDLQQKC